MAGFNDRYFQAMLRCQKELIKDPFLPCYLFWPQTMSLWLESTPGWAEPRCLLDLAEAAREQEWFLVLHPSSSASQNSLSPMICHI